ncbi:carbohydrate-binding protein [Streptomyces sp. NPDC003016]
MTAANNGTSTPEDDDPFGYLYEDGQAAGAVSPRSGGYGYPGPAAQPGVPRTSYHQVGTVGQRQYGQQQYGQQVPPQQQYGQQVPPQQAYGQQNYSQPNAHYAAPETQPGGAPTRPVPPVGGGGGGRGGGGRSGGPNTKGLLIGAVAVVAVVVLGIGIALITRGGKEDKNPQAGGVGGSTAGATAEPSREPAKKDGKPAAALPKQDAALLKLSPGISTDKTIPGARSSSGAYVPLNAPGASATWKVKVPKAGAYTLSVDYGVPGKDAKTSLTVNGKPHGGGLNMENFAHAEEGAWDKGWTNTFAWVNLTEGENTFVISCGDGDQCEANLDRLELKAGHIK